MTAQAFAPPAEPASLYVGSVMHARMKPASHRFTYEVVSLLIDLDRLDDADRASPFFSVDRFNLWSFRQSDHGPRDGTSLRAWVGRVLADAGLDLTDGRVLLQCYPRVMGYVFDPLSVYFCYGRDGGLAAAVYEVRNTFGEHHTYVAPVRAGEMSAAGLRQSRRKLFYVSPFNAVDMDYLFRLRPPTDDIAIRILATDSGGPHLAATFHGSRRALTSAALLAAWARFPLLTLKVVAAIHWEALKLWLKGLRMVPRPVAPPPLSHDGEPLAPPSPRQANAARADAVTGPSTKAFAP
jgi:hypothetical protein